MVERNGARENGSDRRNLLEAARPTVGDDDSFVRTSRDRGAAMDPIEKPQVIPKGLAKQFALVFMGGIGVGTACILVGFLLGYNARSSKTSALEPPPRSIAAPNSGTGSPAPQTQSGALAPSASLPASGSSSVGAKDSPQAGTISPAESSAPPSPSGVAGQSEPAPSNPPASSVARPVAAAPGPARAETPAFIVQVGSHHPKGETSQVTRVLVNLGYSVLPASRDAGAGAESYRVQVGPYASHQLAEQAAQKLEMEGFQPFVFPVPEPAGPGPENRAASLGVRDPASSAMNGKRTGPAARPQPAAGQPLKRQPAGKQPAQETAQVGHPSTEPTETFSRNPPPSLLAVLTPALPPPPAPVQTPGAPLIVDQVLASTNVVEVTRKVTALKGLGFPAFTAEPRAGDKIYRALVGPFESRAQAEATGKKLVLSGSKSFMRFWQSAPAADKQSPGK